MFEKAKRCADCKFCVRDMNHHCYVCGFPFCGQAIDDLEECPKERLVVESEEKKEPSLSEIVCRLMDEKKALFQKKAAQYGIGDELANFRDGAAAMQLDPESLDACFQALKGYCNKHVSFVQRSKELNEKVDESLGDIAVYALIAQAMWIMKKGE